VLDIKIIQRIFRIMVTVPLTPARVISSHICPGSLSECLRTPVREAVWQFWAWRWVSGASP